MNRVLYSIIDVKKFHSLKLFKDLRPTWSERRSWWGARRLSLLTKVLLIFLFFSYFLIQSFLFFLFSQSQVSYFPIFLSNHAAGTPISWHILTLTGALIKNLTIPTGIVGWRFLKHRCLQYNQPNNSQRVPQRTAEGTVSPYYNDNNALDRNPPTMREVQEIPITNDWGGTNSTNIIAWWRPAVRGQNVLHK